MGRLFHFAFFVQLEDDGYKKVFFSGARNEYNWGSTFDVNHEKSAAKYEVTQEMIDANDGMFSLTISARSREAALDEIHLQKDSVSRDHDAETSQLVLPEPDPVPAEPVVEPTPEEPAPEPVAEPAPVSDETPIEEPTLEPDDDTPVEEPGEEDSTPPPTPAVVVDQDTPDVAEPEEAPQSASGEESKEGMMAISAMSGLAGLMLGSATMLGAALGLLVLSRGSKSSDSSAEEPPLETTGAMLSDIIPSTGTLDETMPTAMEEDYNLEEMALL
ncbi:MAG: hypothetical protein AAFQ64_07685 [Pseudomonadota bacterium]